MKKILLALLITSFYYGMAGAQAHDINVWDITRNHLKEIGELSKNNPGYPLLSDSMVIYSFFVYNKTTGKDAQAPIEILPVTDSMTLYLFKANSAHAYKHFLVVKNGDYGIITMRADLHITLKEAISLSRRLDLDLKEALYLLEQILWYYENDVMVQLRHTLHRLKVSDSDNVD